MKQNGGGRTRTGGPLNHKFGRLASGWTTDSGEANGRLDGCLSGRSGRSGRSGNNGREKQSERAEYGRREQNSGRN